MGILVSFPKLTHAVTCMEVLSVCVRLGRIKQRTSGAELPYLSQEKANVIV